jgi:hypothetical protein
MAYLGLVPSEHSSGANVKRGSLTKPAPGSEQGAGNSAARRLLIEAAWCHRFPARVSRELRLRQEAQPRPIREIAWKAQLRLCARYRKLARGGKPANVVTAAIARELAGFIWAIAEQRAKDAALQPPAGQRGEEGLYRIGPGAGGGREMKRPARMPGEPGAHPGREISAKPTIAKLEMRGSLLPL